MSGFIEGENRHQSTLFPERVDDYVEEESVVRVVDVFIDQLDISGLGFKTEHADTGRPGYHPRTLLKIYVYGYLNQVHSSRRLEREANRNVELMWLTGRLAPDFKTIADFRRNNGAAIRLVCREFVMLCRKLDLLSDMVAVDGSKFKAVNNRDKNFTKAKMKRRIAEVEASIERYLDQLDKTDRATPAEDKRPIKDKIRALKEEMNRLKKLEVRRLESPDEQLSLTDPDARSMKSRGSGVVGYNVQTAVDVETHLIVAHDVTNVGIDRRQLSPMAKQAQQVLATGNDRSISVVADQGYYRGEELKACEEAGITAYVAKSDTSGKRGKGEFSRRDFRYIPEADEYECPARERAIYRFTRTEAGKQIRRYWSSACVSCPIKWKCTPSDYRRVSRWEHEDVIERAESRLRDFPDAMRIRRATVEHPFGTLKQWMGSGFLTKQLGNVNAEMSLHVLAYNMKRAVRLVGVKKLMEAI
ncbi:MAG: IS1182 family transposase [Pseudomonadota bacterium]